MSEMHLDLCIQSTNHLLETVASIKENIRILEVFLNSGLISVDLGSKGCTLNSEHYISSDGRSSAYMEKTLYQPLEEMMTSSRKNHSNCCCLCRFRQVGASRESRYRPDSRGSAFSAATLSLISNNVTDTKRKVRSGPRLIPRLNKTASLRRESALQKVGLKNSFL